MCRGECREEYRSGDAALRRWEPESGDLYPLGGAVSAEGGSVLLRRHVSIPGPNSGLRMRLQVARANPSSDFTIGETQIRYCLQEPRRPRRDVPRRGFTRWPRGDPTLLFVLEAHHLPRHRERDAHELADPKLTPPMSMTRASGRPQRLSCVGEQSQTPQARKWCEKAQPDSRHRRHASVEASLGRQDYRAEVACRSARAELDLGQPVIARASSPQGTSDSGSPRHLGGTQRRCRAESLGPPRCKPPPAAVRLSFGPAPPAAAEAGLRPNAWGDDPERGQPQSPELAADTEANGHGRPTSRDGGDGAPPLPHRHPAVHGASSSTDGATLAADSRFRPGGFTGIAALPSSLRSGSWNRLLK